MKAKDIRGGIISLKRCRGIYGTLEAWESEKDTWAIRDREQDLWTDTGLSIDTSIMGALSQGENIFEIEQRKEKHHV